MRTALVSFAAAQSNNGLVPTAESWPTAELILDAAANAAGDPQPILQILAEDAYPPPTPGNGHTRELWELLASVSVLDLSAARALEPHLDAAAILYEASIPWAANGSWAVYAAEGQGMRLEAEQVGDSWILNGTKPWCSLSTAVDRALVSAHTVHGRALFAVHMRDAGIAGVPQPWVSHGLHRIPSGPVQFHQVRAEAVKEPGWYLQRPGFAIGGVGVAACWFGAAVGIFRDLLHRAESREPDQLALAWLGEADRLLAAGASTLKDAATLADRGELGPIQAHRARGTIAQICERIIQLHAHATGPAPLAFDEPHARRVADLSVYLRQHHAARDDAVLGKLLLDQRQKGDVESW